MKIKEYYLISIMLLLFLIVSLFIPEELNAQTIYKRWNTFDINKITTLFSNYGTAD